jgi:hypothetical protein
MQVQYILEYKSRNFGRFCNIFNNLTYTRVINWYPQYNPNIHILRFKMYAFRIITIENWKFWTYFGLKKFNSTNTRVYTVIFETRYAKLVSSLECKLILGLSSPDLIHQPRKKSTDHWWIGLNESILCWSISSKHRSKKLDRFYFT